MITEPPRKLSIATVANPMDSESIAKGRQCIFVRGRDLYCELLNFLPVLLFNPLQGFHLDAFDIDFQQVDALQNSAAGSGRSMCTLRRAM